MTIKLGRKLAVAASTLALTGGLLAIALPAQASPSNCPSGSACIWADSTYRTTGLEAGLKGFALYVPDYSGWTYAGTSINANNSATSVYNNGNSESAYFYNATYPSSSTAPQFYLAKKTGDGNVSNSVGIIFNMPDNTISSGYFTSYLP